MAGLLARRSALLAAFPEISPVASWPQAPGLQLRVQPRIFTGFPIGRPPGGTTCAHCRNQGRGVNTSPGDAVAWKASCDRMSQSRLAAAAREREVSEIDAANGLYARIEGMLDRDCISLTRSAYSQMADFASLPVRMTLVPGERAFETLEDSLFRQVVVAQGNVDLIQERPVRSRRSRASRVACLKAAWAVAVSRSRSWVSQVKPSPMVCQSMSARELREEFALAGFPGAFDELHHADLLAPAKGADDHAEGGTRLALAVAGVDEH